MNSRNDCDGIRLAAMALADGEPTVFDSRQIGEHLERCEPCRNLARQEQQPLIPETAWRAQHAVDLWPAIERCLTRDYTQPAVNRSNCSHLAPRDETPPLAEREGYIDRVVPAHRWRASWIVGLSTIACLLVAGSLWMTLGRQLFPGPIEKGVPEASSKPLSQVTTWDPPEHVNEDEFRERFAVYFEPEFQEAQAARIGSGVNVDELRPVIIPGRHGPLGTLFIDRAGVVLLAIKYPLVSEFHEGLAGVGTVVHWKDGGRISNFGFIDRTGKMVVAPEYDYSYRFSEGLAAVHKKNKWGYINRAGQTVIALQYRLAESFQDGVGAVELEDNTLQFIDPAGKVLLSSHRSDVGRFSEGLLHVNLPGTPGIDSGRARGYVNRKFAFVFRLGDDSSGFWPARCEEFHDGMAAVEVGGSNCWGFITREGKLTIRGPYFQVNPFSEGLAAVNAVKGATPKWGYIDRDGKTIIEPEFLGAGQFAEGLASVLIAQAGTPAADRPAEEDGSPVRGKWGYIDRSGHIAIEPRFYTAAAFEHGLARVSENPAHVGFIDKTGTYVWQFTEPAFGR